MIWQTDPTRWMTKDGQHYYLVPVSQLGADTIEKIHVILRQAERKAYRRQWMRNDRAKK